MTFPTQEQLDALESWEQRIVFPNGLAVGTWPVERFGPLFGGVNLVGKTALDIGCNAGNQTLRMEQAGARVTGIDVDPLHEKQFTLVKKAFGLRARYVECPVEDIPCKDGYDVVLFAGVLYHVHDPFRALLAAWHASREVMLLESDSTPGDDRPVAFFVRNDSPWQYANWWLPTRRCLLDMCSCLDGVSEIRDVTGEYPGPYGARVMIQVWRGKALR